MARGSKLQNTRVFWLPARIASCYLRILYRELDVRLGNERVNRANLEMWKSQLRHIANERRFINETWEDLKPGAREVWLVQLETEEARLVMKVAVCEDRLQMA